MHGSNRQHGRIEAEPAQGPCRLGSMPLQQARPRPSRKALASQACGGSPAMPSPHRGGARFPASAAGPQGQAKRPTMGARRRWPSAAVHRGPAIAGTTQSGRIVWVVTQELGEGLGGKPCSQVGHWIQGRLRGQARAVAPSPCLLGENRQKLPSESHARRPRSCTATR